MPTIKIGLSFLVALIASQVFAEIVTNSQSMQRQSQDGNSSFYMTSLSSSYSSATINGKTVSQGEMSVNNMISSKYDFATTISRLEKAFAEKNLTVFRKIDHQQVAKEKGLEMQPSMILVFGNSKVSPPHINKEPFFALELPLKVVISQTQNGVVVVFKNTQSLLKDSKFNQQDVANNFAKVEKLITKTVTQ